MVEINTHLHQFASSDNPNLAQGLGCLLANEGLKEMSPSSPWEDLLCARDSAKPHTLLSQSLVAAFAMIQHYHTCLPLFLLERTLHVDLKKLYQASSLLIFEVTKGICERGCPGMP